MNSQDWKNKAEGIVSINENKRLSFVFQHNSKITPHNDSVDIDNQHKTELFAKDFIDTIGQELTPRQALTLAYSLVESFTDDCIDKNEKIDNFIKNLNQLKK